MNVAGTARRPIEGSSPGDEGGDERGQSPGNGRRGEPRGVLHRALRRPSGAAGAALLALLAAMVVIGPMLYGVSANEVDYSAKVLRPSLAHLAGTDAAGRDQLSRLLAGGRTSLRAAGIVLIGEVCIGVFVGVIAGIRGGWLERSLMRLVDVLLALPSQIVALAVVGALGPGFGNLVIALVVSGWASYARISRVMITQGRTRPYVVAARLAGTGPWRAAFRHLLPETTVRISVVATLGFGSAIVGIAGLSFLGLGVQPPDAEWGAMLNEARFDITTAPWLLVGPAGAIFLCVFALNLFGDALRSTVEDTGRTRR